MKTDAHARPRTEAEEPLYDPALATPTHGERAMTLACRARTATLCKIAREPAGYPYGSFVTYAIQAGHPVFLISTLAEHTRNLAADPRASLLIAESDHEDPLANGRVTLIGYCRTLEDEEGRREARDAAGALPRLLTGHGRERSKHDRRGPLRIRDERDDHARPAPGAACLFAPDIHARAGSRGAGRPGDASPAETRRVAAGSL